MHVACIGGRCSCGGKLSGPTRALQYVVIEVWPGWIEGPMEFTQTAAWLRRDYTEQVLDWSRDKARLAIQIR
jgi:hypothetical protein